MSQPPDPDRKPLRAQTTSGDSDDFERDSLHILPLKIIPLETPGLQRAKLIKNVRMETVIEIFNEAAAGSGQVYPEDIAVYFENAKAEMERDMVKVRKLALANSFDVYTLRIELRRLNIDVNKHSDLTLSESKKRELTEYMKAFTRPLIKHVYGNEGIDFSDVDDLIQMFAAPNREEAIRNLKLMAEKLRIGLNDIPNFLEEYGDIFLSLAYFKRGIDELVPEINRFLLWVEEAMKSREVQTDTKLSKVIADVNHDITDVTTSITGRFESFDQRSRDFWNDINADTFRRIRNLITSHHVTIGGVLCGLAVKMNLWKLRFGRGGGGPYRRIEFIKSEILPGLSHIKSLEQSARTIVEQ